MGPTRHSAPSRDASPPRKSFTDSERSEGSGRGLSIDCYQKAVQLLTARPHFRRELQLKLTRRGYSEDETAAALDRLTEQGYLDDLRAARGLAAKRLARGEGRARVRAELLRHGAPAEVAEQVVAELAPEDDRAAALAAAEKWRRRGGADPGALARHLARKGFSRRAIVAALQQEPAEVPDLLP